MRKRLLSFMMFLPVTMSISAQIDLDLPGLTSPKNVKVTDVGRYTEFLAETLLTDSLTGRQDTVYQSVPEVVWQSEGEDIYRDTQAPRRALSPIKLIDSEGKPIRLSGIAATPNPKQTKEVNNMLIGTHITITSNAETPSNQTSKLDLTDWGVLFSMASGKPTEIATGVKVGRVIIGLLSAGLSEVAWSTTDLIRNAQFNKYRHNFVVMPDYEGYGETVNRAHPYLYQARSLLCL